MNFAEDNSVVSIRAGSKSYKPSAWSKTQVRVFHNLNLDVKQGQIYALLGPNGSGKTTILRCILGQQTLDCGTIQVYGYQPGSEESGVPGAIIGYMPQETCLFDIMTIGENFWYYGTLVGMSKEDIKKQAKFYTALLRLPSRNRFPSQLSYGQGRLVSFALALLHQPHLIILDEPTLGMDPLLKDRMWKHLIHLTIERKVTVMLTTPHTEEAEVTHRIGMLHDGTMVHEGDTKNSMHSFSCTTLEEVYEKVCKKPRVRVPPVPPRVTPTDGNELTDIVMTKNEGAEASTSHQESMTRSRRWTTDILPKKKSFNNHFSRSTCRHLHLRWTPLKSIIIKNLLVFLRPSWILVFTLLLPSVIITAIFHLFGNLSPLPVNVVNEDSGQYANMFLSQLNKDIIELVPTDSLKTAELNFANQEVIGIIHIYTNFTTLFQAKLTNGYIATKEVADSKLFAFSIDNSVIIYHHQVSFHVVDQFINFIESWNNDTFKNLYPVMFNDNTEAVVGIFRSHMLINALCTVVVFFAAAACAVMVLFVELQNGSLKRTFVTGTSLAEVIIGMMVVLLAIVGLQTIFTITTMYFLNENMTVGKWFMIFLLFLILSLSGSAYGIFLSVLSNHVYVIVCNVSLCFVAVIPMSGAIFPIAAAPYFFQYLSKALPLYFPVQAELRIVMSESKVSDHRVMLGFVTSVIWTFVFLMLSVKRLTSLK